MTRPSIHTYVGKKETGNWKDERILGHKERNQEGQDNLYIVVGNGKFH